MSGPLPLVVFDTNVLFDFFLGRDPDVMLLAQLAGSAVEFRVPEFVLMEFRGSVLKELGKKEEMLGPVRALANELDRADSWMSAADHLRNGADLASSDILRLKARVDPFLTQLRKTFTIVPHSIDVHYRGDLRFVQGLPPDRPKRGVQDCRVFEAVLDIARNDQTPNRPEKLFFTKDSDFDRPGVAEELKKFDFNLESSAGRIYYKYHAA